MSKEKIYKLRLVAWSDGDMAFFYDLNLPKWEKGVIEQIETWDNKEIDFREELCKVLCSDLSKEIPKAIDDIIRQIEQYENKR